MPALTFHGCIGITVSKAYMSMGRSVVPLWNNLLALCMFRRYVTLNRFPTCSYTASEPEWKALVADHIKCGKLRQALNLYQRFQKGDASQPCRRTFVALLKACTKLKDLINGYRIHGQIARMGLLETDVFVGSSLVDMYAKCGLLPKAHQVFNKLSVRDAVLWTTLIAGYAEHGHGEEALSCFEQMQLDGVSPDAVAFVYSLKACSSIGAIDKGQEIHAQIERSELRGRDELVGSALIDMYAKFGFPFKAKQVFDKLLVHDTVIWTTLMSGYVEHGYNEEALKCFEQMRLEGISPDAHTFVCCLRACGNIKAMDKGQELHTCIEREKMMKTDLVLGNALVDMYTKCGTLVRAQQVFDKLPVRDVISWTALISGYCEHGHGEVALQSFEHMQVEGISPNSVTYVCILKVCGSLGAGDKGIEIHAQIEIEGLSESDLTVGNALLCMYANCGLLAMAQQVFDTIPVRDVISWTTIIAGYTEHGCGEEALKFFDLMQMKGVSPNSLTFVCSLKACGSIRAFNKGLEIHAQIERMGLSVDSDIVVATLIDMYTKCGALVDACQLFERLPARDIVSWTILIASYVEHGRGEEALECFQQMQIEGISPDAFTFVCSLKACSIMRTICYGQEIHAEIERKGLLEQDIVVGTALIDMYFICDSPFQGQEVFDRLPVRDSVSWTTLITGYVKQGYNKKALKCFDLMRELGVSPNAGTFVCCLNACASIGATKEGQEIHVDVERQGLLEEDLVVGNALVDMYGRLGLIPLAQQVFNKLPVRDVGAWNALMGGYAEHDHGDQAIECFEQMQLEGVSADAVTFVYILKACGSIMAGKKGKELHARFERVQFFVEDVYVSCALMDMYAKCGMLRNARHVFDKLQIRNVVSWTTLIAGYVEHGHAREALQCFERMKFEGISPNAATFVCILKACGSIGAAARGAEIHAEIERKGFAGKDIIVGNTLVDMYAKCGSLAIAQGVFDRLSLRDMASWNALLAGYAENESVFLILNRMMGENVEPDPVTLLVVLSACSLTGMLDKSYTYYESMSKHFSVVPTLEHHNCAVNLLCRAGQLDKATAMIMRAPFHSNVVMWHSVLSACKKYGHLTLGERAFECTAYLDAKDVPV